jgi:tetratricopeptide (TPR) repeat protein
MALHEPLRSLRAITQRPAGLAAAIIVALTLGLAWFSRRHGRDDPEAFYREASRARQAAQIEVGFNRDREAEQYLRNALAALNRLADHSPTARPFRRERAAVLELLAQIRAASEIPREAVPFYREAIDIYSKLLAEDPISAEDRWPLARCLNRLGVLLRGAGRWDEAESTFMRGRLLCEKVPDGLRSDTHVVRERVHMLEQQGSLFLESGRLPESLDCYTIAVAAQKSLIDSELSSETDRERLVVLLIDLAKVYTASRQRTGAEAALSEARDIGFRLVRDFPATVRYLDLVATALDNLAETIKTDASRRTQAIAPFERAIAIQERLVAEAPSSRANLAKLAATCDRLACLWRELGSHDQAETYYRRALAIQSRLARERPDERSILFANGRALHNLADLLRNRGRSAEALELERAAVERLGLLYRGNVTDPDYRRAFSYASWGLCDLLLASNDVRAASDAIAEYQTIERNGYEELLESARFLCKREDRGQQDQAVSTSPRDALAKSYADRAMIALEQAVRYGFRDLEDLRTSSIYHPLRNRDDFVSLLRGIELSSDTESQSIEARPVPGRGPGNSER